MLLIHQVPTKPAYFRVKIWRRLQGSAVAVKSTVYALPANAETQEDFEWLLKEIAEGGGDAMLCEARMIDGLSDAQVRALFDAAPDADYEAIAGEVRSLATALDADDSAEKQAEARAQLGRLRKRLAETETIDFFGATGRVVVEGLIAELERRVRKEISVMTEDKAATPETLAGLKGRTWVVGLIAFPLLQPT